MSLSESQRRKFRTARREMMRPHQKLLQAKALMLCSLPRRSTDEAKIERTVRVGASTRFRLVYTAANDMPYGADRALLAWIQTEAFKNDGLAALGNLQRGYFDLFGLENQGYNYNRFYQALDRVRGLSFYLEISGGGEEATTGSYPIEETFTLRDFKGEGLPPALTDEFPAKLVSEKRYGVKLSERFMAFFAPTGGTHPVVPIPLPLMRAFHNWPLGWDIAQLVLWRQYAARSATVIPEDDLFKQLAITDSNTSRVRKKIKKALQRLRVVYPEMPSRYTNKGHSTRGLLITNWTPPKHPKPNPS